MIKLHLRIFILVILCSVINAQKDSIIPLFIVGVHGGGELPSSDMVKRFGPDLTAGGTVLRKTKQNFLYGIEGNYFSGATVKEDVLRQMKNAEGSITNNEGYPTDLRINERGLSAQLLIGKILNIDKKNKNSGLIFTFGLGYIQHKVHFYTQENKLASVNGSTVYGYDRLTAGISGTQFIGYLHLSRRRMINYYAGFTFLEGVTKSLRKFNYDTAMPDTKWRFDVLSGFRIGWIMPLYKKMPNDFYYD